MPTAPDSPRKTQLNLVVGINGTGKTTFLRQQVVQRRPKSLVLTPDESEWRQLPTISEPGQIHSLTGAARIIYQGTETLEAIVRYYSGGALILDDAMAYLTFQTPDTLRFLYIRRRQRGIDAYIVAHGLRQVPAQCFTFGTYLILFATTENFSSRRRELDDQLYRRILDTQQSLNQQCRSGKDPYAHAIIKLDPTA